MKGDAPAPHREIAPGRPLTSFGGATNMPEARATCGRGPEQDTDMASFTNNLEVAVVRARTGSDLPNMGGMSVSGEGRHR
jgi:hypothetical protein